MALKPELVRRRKRVELPRAPERPLGAKTEGLGQPVRIPDEELKELLEQLVALADRETLFTMTLEKHRLLSALSYAGFLASLFYNFEGQIGPGATVTVYLPVPAGFVLSPVISTYYSSLPWWLSVNIWIDLDVPAAPIISLLRAPDYYNYTFAGLSALTRFMRFTVTNNHPVNTANYLAIQGFDIMTLDTWHMLETIYLKPIVEYAQEQAEKLTGRPFP